MRTWIRPMVIEECYVSNESIADSVTACYKIACEVGKTNDKDGPMNYTWPTPESTGIISTALFHHAVICAPSTFFINASYSFSYPPHMI